MDEQTASIVRLFSPRTDFWGDHFELRMDGAIHGKTAIGRATVELLRFNRPEHIDIRQALVKIGHYPPAASR